MSNADVDLVSSSAEMKGAGYQYQFESEPALGAGYLRLKEGERVDYSVHVDGVVLDFNRDEGLVGIEILDLNDEVRQFFGISA